MKLIEAIKKVNEGKAVMIFRNPMRRGEKAIEYWEV